MEYRIIKSEDAPEVGALPNTHGYAAFENGELVAYVGLTQTISLDPLWIRPDKRKSPFLLRRLWENVKRFLSERGVKSVGGITVEGQENADLVGKIAEGLAHAEGSKVTLYSIPIDDAQDVVV